MLSESHAFCAFPSILVILSVTGNWKGPMFLSLTFPVARIRVSMFLLELLDENQRLLRPVFPLFKTNGNRIECSNVLSIV
jgi:hypothetical protein